MKSQNKMIYSLNLDDVYNYILELQNNNEFLISKDSLHSLKNIDRYVYFIVKNSKEAAIGYMIIKNAVDIAELEYILVDKDFRNCGVGTMLIQELTNYCVQNGIKKIMLEVRNSNKSAISFYKKSGFNEISIRKKYYTSPTEDAIIYEKIILS